MNNQYKLILATDLDGTFLEGDQEIKDFFYREILRLREHIILIYTTGRSINAVEEFCREGYLPYSNYIIADHGTHIVDGRNFNLIEYLQNPIMQKWNNGNDKLKKLLQGEEGIQLQPINPPYRVAYYYHPAYLKNQTLKKIVNAGFDVIQSHDMYLDILPRGVNKGSSLLNMLDYLNLHYELVITCGDSLNDLSLFQTGLKSIAVGNSEPNLVVEIKKLNNVYLSVFPGLHGIIDGLCFYKKDKLFNLNNLVM